MIDKSLECVQRSGKRPISLFNTSFLRLLLRRVLRPSYRLFRLLRWCFEAVPVVRLVLVADVLLAQIRNGDRDGAAEQGPQTADPDKGGDDAPVDVEVGRLTGLHGTGEALADECIVAAIPHWIMHRVLDLS